MAITGETVRRVRALLRELYEVAEEGPGARHAPEFGRRAAEELDRFCRAFEDENGCELFLEDLHPDLDKIIPDGEIRPVDKGLREACIALGGTVAEWYHLDPHVQHAAKDLPYAVDDWGRRK